MYNKGFRITENTGNNAFSYDIRKQNNPDPQIYVTDLIQGPIDYIQIGDNIVFEEVDNKGQIQSFVGLKHFVKLRSPLIKGSRGDLPIYIVDNHNHALFFRYQELINGNIPKGIELIHIDQHTDMNNNSNVILSKTKDINNIFHFTNHQCNVGNFIQPAIQDGLISQVLQINTEYTLLQYSSHCEEGNDKAILNKKKIAAPTSRNDGEFILDIDLDFRHPQMGIEKYIKTINITKNLISNASLVTIATSPYFLDQTLAIKILNDIFLN